RADHVRALFYRADLLHALGRSAEALVSLDRALKLAPGDAAALTAKGLVLADLRRPDEALAAHRAALALDPNRPEIWINAGHVLVELQREHEALDAYAQALRLSPHDPDASFNQGVNRLRLGDFARGWEGYEQRWHTRAFAPLRRSARHPTWNGEPLAGSLLVQGEQGLGEHILFAGLLPDLATRVQNTVVEVEPRLVPLFARSFAGVVVVARGHAHHEPEIGAQIDIGSLGLHLRRDASAFPMRSGGYLRCDPVLAAQLRARLADGRLLVGLSWNSRNPKFEAAKSVSLADYAPLLRLPGCRFVDLQYGDTRAERAAATRDVGVIVEHIDDVDNTNDIDSLAALIGACDVVVTVSNTTAHLAGALGKPTFVLVPFGRGRMWFW